MSEGQWAMVVVAAKPDCRLPGLSMSTSHGGTPYLASDRFALPAAVLRGKSRIKMQK